jgi:hypothetical protein
MTNYVKKRQRQNGRQGHGFMSDSAMKKLREQWDKEHEMIRLLIDAGELPAISFDLSIPYEPK